MKLEPTTAPQERGSWTLVPVAWLLLAVAAPAAIVWFAGRDGAKPGEHGPAVQGGDLPGATRDEQALAEYRARVQEWLESYGWVDREAGIARVPIQQGMQAVLRAGLPAREEVEEDR